MKNKLTKIGIIILGLLILLSTTVLGKTDISSLLEAETTDNVEPITSVSSQITKILGTASDIIITIILVIAAVFGVIIWSVIYSSKIESKSKNVNNSENKGNNNEENK